MSCVSQQQPNLVDYEQLYSINWSNVICQGGSALLQLYSGSPSLAVLVEYPEVHWRRWDFDHASSGFWRTLATLFNDNDAIAEAVVREYVEMNVAKDFGVNSPEDWPRVLSTRARVPSASQHRLIHFGGIDLLISKLYPHLDLPKLPQTLIAPSMGLSIYQLAKLTRFVAESTNEFHFSKVTSGYWDHPSNRKHFMNYVMGKLGSNDPSVLYQLTRSDVIRLGGLTLLNRHGSSVAEMVTQELPDHPWQMWRFSKAPHGYWHRIAAEFQQGDPAAQQIIKDYVHYLEAQLSVTSPQDWPNTLKTPGFSSRLGMSHYRNFSYFGGLPKVLSSLYPDIALEGTTGTLRIAFPIKSELTVGAIQVTKPPPARSRARVRTIQARAEPLSRSKIQSGDNQSVMTVLRETLFPGELDELYKVTRKAFRQIGGMMFQWRVSFSLSSPLGVTASATLVPYRDSPAFAVMHQFADHCWRPWRFIMTPRGWWKKLAIAFQQDDPIAIAVAKDYLETDLAPQLKVKSLEDWNSVSIGTSTSEYHRIAQLGPLNYILNKVYPGVISAEDQQSLNQSIVTKPLDYWDDPNHRAEFMQRLKAHLGGQMEDFYKVSRKHFVNLGGTV